MKLAGIDPNDCFMSNVCKCRPPDKRTPRKGEVLACYQWLKTELSLTRPPTIITLGATPLKLFTLNGVKQMHGTQMSVEVEVDEA